MVHSFDWKCQPIFLRLLVRSSSGSSSAGISKVDGRGGSLLRALPGVRRTGWFWDEGLARGGDEVECVCGGSVVVDSGGGASRKGGWDTGAESSRLLAGWDAD